MEEALERLSHDHRYVVVEIAVNQRACSDVAVELGVPEGTVRSRLYYALRALGFALADLGYDEAGEPCGDRRELLALDAVGQLPAEREAELVAHLQCCARCTEELGRLSAAAAAAGAGASGPASPADLAEKVSLSLRNARRGRVR